MNFIGRWLLSMAFIGVVLLITERSGLGDVLREHKARMTGESGESSTLYGGEQ